MDARFWLQVEGGARLAGGEGGLLIGRDPRCDVVLADPTASRRHALVRAESDGVYLHVLGRSGARVGGDRADGVRRLTDGDRVEVPGAVLRVALPEGPPAGSGWLLQLASGPAVRLPLGAWAVGEGLDLAGWPAGAFTLDVAPERVDLRTGVEVRRNGVALAPGRTVELYPFDVVEGAGPAVTLLRPDAVPEPTRGPSDPEAFDEVEATMVARGGQLVLRRGAEEVRVWLAERRFTLVACLLEPRSARPGEDVDDEEVLARVWPRQSHKSRVDLNVLVGRVRADLEAAGAPRTLLERAEGGGGTRFRLAPGARVKVR